MNSPSLSFPPLRWGRIVRLTVFALAALLIAADVAAAWVFTTALVYPGCPEARPLPGVPAPERVQLEAADGVRVEAWYYPSQNRAAVIALGGQGGALGEALPPVRPLVEAGFGVLQIGSRSCAGEAVTLGYREADDAAAGLAFLQSRPEVAEARIGVFGFSMGGVAAIRAAARNPEIAAVVAEGGFYNLGEDFVEPGERKSPPRTLFLYTLAGTFWLRTGANPWQISPVEDIARLSPRPVLLIYGENEAESGRARAQFEAAGQPKELWIVPGGDHGRNHLVAGPEYERRVLAFFSRTLGGEGNRHCSP